MKYLMEKKGICYFDSRSSQGTVLLNIKKLCKRNLFTFEGRISCTKQILNIKSLVPLYINKSICLLPLQSLRYTNGVWLNYFEIKCAYNDNNMVNIIFQDGEILLMKLNLSFFRRQIAKAERVINYLENGVALE